MNLIISGAYINPSLAAEFGELPPTMLPLKNKRLYIHQRKLFPENEKVFISLPESYNIDEFDKINMQSINIEVISVNENLSLSQSIIFCLNYAGKYSENLNILNGDTLFKELDFNQTDYCACTKPENNYKWDYIENKNLIYSGYFSFSNQNLLIKLILQENYNFIKAIEDYSNIVSNYKYIEIKGWMDFGLLSTYFKSKSNFTTERVFNGLKIDKFSVLKESFKKKKILAEAEWFKKIPSSLYQFTPRLWDFKENKDKSSYIIDFFHLSTLSDLYVYGRLPVFVWENIFSSFQNFISVCKIESKNYELPSINFSKIYYSKKTNTRLQQFQSETNYDFNDCFFLNDKKFPSVNYIIDEMTNKFNENDFLFLSIIHGDLCFSNTLYDFKTESIKVIDPKGLIDDNENSFFGDFRYDVAKISHSVIGLYDFIIAGNYFLEEKSNNNFNFKIYQNKNIEKIQTLFLNCKFNGFSLEELSIYPIMINLFLSMLPLHNDMPERQKAFLCNAIRLYDEYKSKLTHV
tara:strand:+ start:4248 stop:5804 length:1557 start_codon:yes stop_codon:yes gene_type:complete